MKEFRKIYRDQSVLIIDDIHLLARKVATQEEFFHTFNALHSQGHLIILSSDRAPSKMEEIEPRLISRFEWGIIFQLQNLSDSDLIQVLKKRGDLFNFPLKDEVIHFLIETFSKSTKSLMRAFEALVLRSPNTTFPRNKEEASKLIQDLIAEETESKLTLEKIAERIAVHFGIPVSDILGKSQTHECVLPRQLTMYLSRQFLKLPYSALGKFFSRDHSTVISSIKLIQKKIDEKDFLILQAIESFSTTS
jgi:chromosomal replication initiator protein